VIADRQSGYSMTFRSANRDCAGSGLDPKPDFGKFIAQETEKWAEVIWAANVKA
jgi:hypothetical protein